MNLCLLCISLNSQRKKGFIVMFFLEKNEHNENLYFCQKNE